MYGGAIFWEPQHDPNFMHPSGAKNFYVASRYVKKKRDLDLQSWKVAFTVASSRRRRNFPIVVTGTSNNPRNIVTLFYGWEGSANGCLNQKCLHLSVNEHLYFGSCQSCQF